MTNGKMELLSPAGTIEKLRTAFNYGADAAYMGLKSFSLRANAGNIDYSQAQELVELKKESGKKVYCTANIFFHEDEITKLKSSISEIKAFPFDAFIISDIGVYDIFRDAFPDVEIHLSTQANCINAHSASMYAKMGFNRVILGRETPIEDIRIIRDANPDLGIEVFVHGAMCMSYSGRCMLSSYLTGRSANQGDCAHTCRWNYRFALEEEERPGRYYPIAEDEGYTTILSSKDLCMIDHLAQLKDAGVDSLKIEGRMKSIYYVATVTRAYRKALDAIYDNTVEYVSFREELLNVSHREYSTGFFFGKGPIDRTDDINTATEKGYMRDYSFLGIIGDQVDKGIWYVDVKNQIRSGQEIEFIGPDVLFIREPSCTVLSADMTIAEHIDHCNEGYIKTDLPIYKGYIIRARV